MIAATVLCSGSAFAAIISGDVRDATTDRFLPGASVTLRENHRTASTDNSGRFQFGDLSPGSYTVVVDYVGYQVGTEQVAVSSEQPAQAHLSLKSDAIELGKFVVEGEREGQALALQQKRSATAIMDVVSSDSAGKLPDGNAAEAVRRLPGVFAEIDQNEGRFIVVRGIDSSLNNITVNGINVGSPDGGSRAVAMDAVPADLISRIEVIKAVTPDMDAQAIGASVNIVTPSAFDHGEPFAYATLAGGYYNGPTQEFRHNDFTPYSGSVSAGSTFGDGKWGIIVGASYSYRHYISNRRSGGNPWFPAAPAGQPGSDIYFPANESLFHYDVQRWRRGEDAAIEFRPDKNNQYALRLTDNHFKDDEGRNLNSFDFFQTAYPASFTPTSAHFTTGRSTVEFRRYLQRHAITNLSFTGKNIFSDDKYTLDYTFARGRAEIIVPDREDWEFRSAANAFPNDIDTSKLYWTVTPSANFYDANSYPFRRVRFRADDETEDNVTAAVNLKRSITLLNHDGFWQIGGKYFTRKKGWDRTNTDFNAATGANAFTLAQPGLAVPAPTLFDGDFRMSPQIDLEAVRAFFRANPQDFVANPAGTLSDSYVNDLRLNEDIGAGYAMGRLNFGKFSTLAGVRVEYSSAEVSQTELPTAGSTTLNPRLNHFTKNYTNVMPGIHLQYVPQKNLVFRAAWTNTLGRPNYTDMAAASTFTYVETAPGSGIYTGSITAGNPGLKPYESRNLDLTGEYYFKNAGIFSVSGFDKQLKNPIFTNAYTRRFTTYEGLNFDSLAYSRPENASSGKIRGVEFNYQQQLTILPSPFNGFGFSLNYTISHSEEHLFTRPTEKFTLYETGGQTL